MKIGIACGGTGGHIFPGLAVADVLRGRGDEVVLWLAGKDVESVAVDGWQGPIVTVRTGGVSSLFSFRGLALAGGMVRAVRQCRRTMKAHQPDVLLAMGSYASVAPVLAARSLRIPVVLHEANVIPGRAIRFLSPLAAVVAIGFDETRRYLKHRRIVLTGMPLRRGKRSEDRDQGEKDRGQRSEVRDQQSSTINHQPSTIPSQPSTISSSPWRLLNEKRFTVLVMGGSRGAHYLNEQTLAAIIQLHQKGKAVQVIHLTGLADEQTVRTQYQQAGVPHAVFGFLHDMAQAYRRTSLAVCRSGASTCGELSCFGIPALLVPYPFAIHQHQLANARAMEAAGAADVRVESELSVEWLVDYLDRRMVGLERLERMKQSTHGRHMGQAAEALADLVEAVGRRC